MDDFTDLSWSALKHVSLRLTVAALLGAVIGWEREIHKRAAGLRTHILVAVGCATFMTLGMDLVQDGGGAAENGIRVENVVRADGPLP